MISQGECVFTTGGVRSNGTQPVLATGPSGRCETALVQQKAT
jgi:hypothetical protein